jgi:hypothetical protein
MEIKEYSPGYSIWGLVADGLTSILRRLKRMLVNTDKLEMSTIFSASSSFTDGISSMVFPEWHDESADECGGAAHSTGALFVAVSLGVFGRRGTDHPRDGPAFHGRDQR